MILSSDAATVPILVSGPDYHHKADICTLASTIFASSTKKFVLLEDKPTSLLNFVDQDVASACTPTHTPRLKNFESVFDSLTAEDDLIYADYPDAGSMFEGGLLPANAVAVTVGSAKVSQCFHANNAVTQTSCKSNAFTQAVMTTHGATLKAQARALAASFEDIAVHNKASSVYLAALPYAAHTFGAAAAVNEVCNAVDVPLCHAYSTQAATSATALSTAVASTLSYRDQQDRFFIKVSNCNEFHIEGGELLREILTSMQRD
eukprot:g5185.t1